MNAVAYFKIKKRMTLNCQTDCKACRLRKFNNGTEKSCNRFEMNFPEKAISIVEDWLINHKGNTRMSEFLKKYPGAKIVSLDDEATYIDIYPCDIDEDMEGKCDYYSGCEECKITYWNEEVENG